MGQLSNYTYDELVIGQTASYSKTIEEQDIQLFASVSGDVNPVHLDQAYAETTQFKDRIAHGMLTAGFISAAFGTQLPGPGSIYVNQGGGGATHSPERGGYREAFSKERMSLFGINPSASTT